MAQLYVKGRMEPILLEPQQAIHLQQLWVSNQLPELIQVAELTFRKAELKSIVLDKISSLTRHVSDLTTEEILTELGEYRQTIRSLTKGPVVDLGFGLYPRLVYDFLLANQYLTVQSDNTLAATLRFTVWNHLWDLWTELNYRESKKSPGANNREASLLQGYWEHLKEHPSCQVTQAMVRELEA